MGAFSLIVVINLLNREKLMAHLVDMGGGSLPRDDSSLTHLNVSNGVNNKHANHNANSTAAAGSLLNLSCEQSQKVLNLESNGTNAKSNVNGSKVIASVGGMNLKAGADASTETKDNSVQEEHIYYLDPRTLVRPSEKEFDQIEKYFTQRIHEGHGEFVFELGSGESDDLGLTRQDLDDSIKTLELVCDKIKCSCMQLRLKSSNLSTNSASNEAKTTDQSSADESAVSSDSTPPVDDSTVKWVSDFLIRKNIDESDFIEVRVAVVGNVDAGKSTLLGVLTNGVLDDGRGNARQFLFRHKHEMESGRTSSVGNDILGFDQTGNVVNKSDGHGSMDWTVVCKKASKVITFIDLAGHEKYLKTTIFGMTGHMPDFCMLMVGSNAGVVGMTKEHLGLALALNVPVFIVVTKIDMCPANILENTMKTLKKLMRAPSVRKMPLEVKTQNDVVMAAHHLTERICPIFQISNVTGQNLDLLKSFFNMLTSRSSSLKNAAGTLSLNIEDAQSEKEKQEIIKAQNKVELLLDDSFSVAGVGTVVSGTVLSGVLRSNTTLMFGPDKLGKFMPIDVRTLQRRRLPVDDAHPGQTVAVAVRKVKRRDVRKGQVLISRQALEEYKVINKNETNGNVKSPLALTEKDKLNEKENATYAPWEFLADVVILHHPTTISLKYQAMIHIGSVRQTGVIKWMDKDHLRTGDKARVKFCFMKHPEFIRDGQKFVFREGRTKAVGVVVERLNTKGKNMCGNISGDNVDGGQGSRSSKSRARAGQRFELK